MQGLNWQNVHIPLAAGLAQGSDDRARAAPALDLAYDIQFDEAGGTQTRLPYAALGSDIVGGGTIGNARRIVRHGGELLLFTNDTLYSWNAQLSKWVSKGTHLAAKVDEEAVLVTTGDQINCDRAELDNTIVYAWGDGTKVYVAARDKTTGQITVSPTAIAGTAVTPRLVALSTKILLFYAADVSGADFCVKAIDPADVATGIASSEVVVLTGPDFGLCYDVVKIPSVDTAILAIQRGTTTSYTIMKVTSALSVTTSTKVRDADGPLAIATTPDGAHAQIARTLGTDVIGDYITVSSLADVTIDQALGTTISGTAQQIAAAYRSTTDGGQYRCYVFWSDQEDTTSAEWGTKYNYVDTAGTIGSQATLVLRVGVGSRAFEYNGHVYVWTVFVGQSTFTGAGGSSFRAQLQNTYYLYRDDAFWVAKAAAARAGGTLASIGILPAVSLTDGTTGFSFCGTERRIIPLGGADGRTSYADRGPRDIKVTFDSNDARRCARLGQTLYIAGSPLLQYDGVSIVEVGWAYDPWTFEVSNISGGSIPDGTYAYKATWRADNARGDLDRSSTASTATHMVSGGAAKLGFVDSPPLHVTRRSSVAVEYWRTQTDPGEDAPFFLVTSKDPADASNPNRFILNAPTSFLLDELDDDMLDAALASVEANPENGGVLENVPPPPAGIIIANDTRLFLGDVAGDPDRVWYSKLRSAGEVAAFHDALTIQIPAEGGDITALAFLNETLIVFRETAIYACAGDGFDNLGGGQNYGPARLLSSDVGAVNHESVCFTPAGLVFKSNKGWYLLNRGWSVNYIGAPVTDYDSETPLAVDLVETQHQVRILSSARMLVFDYLVNQWPEWTIADGVHACIWNGAHVYLAAGGPKVQGTAYTAMTYGIDIETTWQKPLDLQGEVMIDRIELLGEYRSSDLTHLRIRAKYNYDDAGAYVDDKYWPVSPTTVGGPLQVKIGLKRPRCQSFKLRITAIYRHTVFVDDVETVVNDPPIGEALKLTGLALRVGTENNLYSRLPAAQRS